MNFFLTVEFLWECCTIPCLFLELMLSTNFPQGTHPRAPCGTLLISSVPFNLLFLKEIFMGTLILNLLVVECS